MRVCSFAEIFEKIGGRAQDSLVGLIIAESATRASVLTHLERLSINGALTRRQQERFDERVSEMTSSAIRSAGLRTKTCYNKLIDSMKIRDWYVQNPAIDLIISNGPEQAAELEEDQQVILGRNLLQAGEGKARSAIAFLEELSQDGTSWPFHVVRGITMESFANEENEIRLKDRHLCRVLTAVDHLQHDLKDELIAEICGSVDAGAPKDWMERADFENAIDSLNAYPWAAPLVARLEAKAALLPSEEDDA